jgi:ABC-2 type transport system ATP-binding protein
MTEQPAIEIANLVRRYGRTEAVNGLSLRVPQGRCYGFFGRNGAGKTTTIKCLLNLLRPTSGTVRVLGLDPVRDEVAVKSAIAYVPDQVAFYPWMTVRDTLDYVASFRERWNDAVERALIDRFRLDPRQKTSHLSKGQKTQLALTAAIAADPQVLILDEPTSGLDPIVRREFIETVIGAYQESGGAQVQMVPLAVTVLMAVGYAYRNYHFADIGPRRIGAQVATIYVWLVGSMTVAQAVAVRIWR